MQCVVPAHTIHNSVIQCIVLVTTVCSVLLYWRTIHVQSCDGALPTAHMNVVMEVGVVPGVGCAG